VSEAPARGAADKAPAAFRTIREVAEQLAVPQHVLRFWETKFPQIKPLKRGGGRRYYRPEDVALLQRIHALLYAEGYTIRGVQKLLRGGEAKPVATPAAVSAPAASAGSAPAAPPGKAARAAVPRAALEGLLRELEAIRALLRAPLKDA
jgi:DNA-binding transcriptional MerR regulator